MEYLFFFKQSVTSEVSARKVLLPRNNFTIIIIIIIIIVIIMIIIIIIVFIEKPLDKLAYLM